jgi:1-deoxy-D-xylulose-5-phosphate reductoisomerase
MKIPISYALNWPNRQRLSKKMNNLNGTYELRKIKKSEYPCYDLCIEALKIGKNATTIINAANEVAVEYFLQNKIKFTDIPVIIKYILKQSKIRNISNISDILKYDIETRNLTEQLIKTKWK